jgi:hypothetical protein
LTSAREQSRRLRPMYLGRFLTRACGLANPGLHSHGSLAGASAPVGRTSTATMRSPHPAV